VVAGRPWILAVDDEASTRELLRLELVRRYDPDYRVVVEGSPMAALSAVEAAHRSGESFPAPAVQRRCGLNAVLVVTAL
jgi:hypothetical protein